MKGPIAEDIRIEVRQNCLNVSLFPIIKKIENCRENFSDAFTCIVNRIDSYVDFLKLWTAMDFNVGYNFCAENFNF